MISWIKYNSVETHQGATQLFAFLWYAGPVDMTEACTPPEGYKPLSGDDKTTVVETYVDQSGFVCLKRDQVRFPQQPELRASLAIDLSKSDQEACVRACVRARPNPTMCVFMCVRARVSESECMSMCMRALRAKARERVHTHARRPSCCYTEHGLDDGDVH